MKCFTVNKNNVVNLSLWIRELLSGKYAQCRGSLKKNMNFSTGKYWKKERYCCLGVAAEHVLKLPISVTASMKVDPGQVKDPTKGFVFFHIDQKFKGYGGSVCDSTLIGPAYEALGIDKDVADMLMDMNDRQRASFDDIGKKLLFEFLIPYAEHEAQKEKAQGDTIIV